MLGTKKVLVKRFGGWRSSRSFDGLVSTTGRGKTLWPPPAFPTSGDSVGRTVDSPIGFGTLCPCGARRGARIRLRFGPTTRPNSTRCPQGISAPSSSRNCSVRCFPGSEPVPTRRARFGDQGHGYPASRVRGGEIVRKVWAVLLWLTLWLAVPVDAASMTYSVTLESGTSVGDLRPPQGYRLAIFAQGDLSINGELVTRTADALGADGPDITINVAGTLRLLPGARIIAGDGRDGEFASSKGTAVAGDGGRGGGVIVRAAAVISEDALLRAGDGGNGGAATATGNPSARAWGGEGGRGGVVSINASVQDPLTTKGGRGGAGGNATAGGQDAEDCDAETGASASRRGQNASVAGGNGEHAESKGEPGTCGRWGERAGTGGDAEAYGGNGGTAQDGRGGDGGNATAIAGTGGPGMDACFATTKEALELYNADVTYAGHGGAGGLIAAIGGDGGFGLNGGKGGSAYGRNIGGKGGNATPPIGAGGGGANGHDHARPGFPNIVQGGNGGTGAMDGGAGGSAKAEGFSLGSGDVCDAGTSSPIAVGRPIPDLHVGVLLLMAAVLAGARFRVRP